MTIEHLCGKHASINQPTERTTSLAGSHKDPVVYICHTPPLSSTVWCIRRARMRIA